MNFVYVSVSIMLYAVSIFIENIVLILNYIIRAFLSSLTLRNMILFCMSVFIKNIVLFSICAFFSHRERDMTLSIFIVAFENRDTYACEHLRFMTSKLVSARAISRSRLRARISFDSRIFCSVEIVLIRATIMFRGECAIVDAQKFIRAGEDAGS